MLAKSSSHQRMIAVVSRLKKQHSFSIVVVSSEGRELNVHRIETFKLTAFVDFFFFFLFRPDAQARPENFPPSHGLRLGEASRSRLQRQFTVAHPGSVVLGRRCIKHLDHEASASALADYGLIDGGKSK